PGPWLKSVKDRQVTADVSVSVAGQSYLVGDLRNRLLKTSSGDSVAYVTDFFLPTAADEDQLVRFLAGCRTLICENNFADIDADLARKTFPMTSTAVARLANRVGAERLILFHVSDRYDVAGWQGQLGAVRQQFTSAHFPAEWQLE